MKASRAMSEIRKIRDENSLRYLSQSPEERKKHKNQWTTPSFTVVTLPFAEGFIMSNDKINDRIKTTIDVIEGLVSPNSRNQKHILI